MKRMMIFLVLLVVCFSMFAYDNSPSRYQILPEAIWAAASGGGTWTTEVQIYARNTTDPVDVYVWFFYGGGSRRGPFTMTGLTVQHMLKYTNILSTIDSLDSGVFTYYGRVGTVWFQTVDSNDTILVQGKTLHSGGYGKTMNAMDYSPEGNTAAFSPTWRGMMIQGITNSSTYRSTCGFFNVFSTSITVRIALIYSTDAWLGYEDITLVGGEFLAFDPFVRFGVSGTYTNCRIWVDPLAGTGMVMSFGASANNTTNDPAAHIAVQYD